MSQQPTRGTWTKCPHCGGHVNQLEWGEYCQCPHCHQYLRLTAQQRLKITVDTNSFVPLEFQRKTNSQLQVPGYAEKLMENQQRTKLKEAVLAGQATINGVSLMIGVMDSHFMMGTLNTEVGRVIRVLYTTAKQRKLPLIMFIASGGARMQEGIFSLLQMNTILMAKREFDATKQVSISVLTDPTMGGVSASFAFKNDLVIAEKNAQIGFAGQRVIKATSADKLPANFQTAEDLLQHGLVDDVVAREHLRGYLATLLKLHQRG